MLFAVALELLDTISLFGHPLPDFLFLKDLNECVGFVRRMVLLGDRVEKKLAYRHALESTGKLSSAEVNMLVNAVSFDTTTCSLATSDDSQVQKMITGINQSQENMWTLMGGEVIKRPSTAARSQAMHLAMPLMAAKDQSHKPRDTRA